MRLTRIVERNTGSVWVDSECDLYQHDDCYDLFDGNLQRLVLEYPDRRVTLIRQNP